MTNDGINEVGLGAHLLWLTEADYGEFDAQRPALSLSVWLQYVLDNFATVAEAVSWFDTSKVQIVGQSEPHSGRPVTCHLAIDDDTTLPGGTQSTARVADPDKPEASQTLWRTIADLTQGVYLFESTHRPNIIWTTMDALDLSPQAPVKKLDLVHHRSLEAGLVGNVTAEFRLSPPMEFLHPPRPYPSGRAPSR